VDPALEDRDRAAAEAPEPELAGMPLHRGRWEARQLRERDLEAVIGAGRLLRDPDRLAEAGPEDDAGDRYQVGPLPDRGHDRLGDAVAGIGEREGHRPASVSAVFNRSIAPMGVGSAPRTSAA
jgi:hypothetical protein